MICSWSSSSMRVGSPSRALGADTRSESRSDRVGLLWSGGRPLAGCSGVVGHQLPARAGAIRDRESTRLAYALPSCVPSASWSSSLLVPLLGPCERKRARTLARSIRLGRVHRAGGVTPVEVRHAPQSKPVTPALHASRRRSHRRWLRAWAENPGRRASSPSTVLLLRAFVWGTGVRSLEASPLAHGPAHCGSRPFAAANATLPLVRIGSTVGRHRAAPASHDCGSLRGGHRGC